MRRVFVVGGNCFARECCTYIERMAARDPDLRLGGILGHNGYGRTNDYRDYQGAFKGEMEEFDFGEGDCAVIGAAAPEIRVLIYEDLKRKKVPLVNLIDPSCIVYPYAQMGEGNIFAPFCTVSTQSRIGNANVFNGFVSVGHDAVIGDYNFFGPHSQVLGGVRVGDGNQLGAGAVLLPLSRIGSRNRIAPLAAVYKGCGDGSYYLGNPARRVGSV